MSTNKRNSPPSSPAHLLAPSPWVFRHRKNPPQAHAFQQPVSAGGSDHSNLTADEVGRHFVEQIILTACPTVLNCDVLSFDVTRFCQPLRKTRKVAIKSLGLSATKHPDS